MRIVTPLSAKIATTWKWKTNGNIFFSADSKANYYSELGVEDSSTILIGASFEHRCIIGPSYRPNSRALVYGTVGPPGTGEPYRRLVSRKSNLVVLIEVSYVVQMVVPGYLVLYASHIIITYEYTWSLEHIISSRSEAAAEEFLGISLLVRSKN